MNTNNGLAAYNNIISNYRAPESMSVRSSSMCAGATHNARLSRNHMHKVQFIREALPNNSKHNYKQAF